MRGRHLWTMLAMGVLSTTLDAQPRGAWREACAVLVAEMTARVPRLSTRPVPGCRALGLSVQVVGDTADLPPRASAGPFTRRLTLALEARFPSPVLRMGMMRVEPAKTVVAVRGRPAPSYLRPGLANLSRRTDGTTGMDAEFKETSPGVWTLEGVLAVDARVDRVETPVRVTYLAGRPGGPPDPEVLDPEGRTLPREVWTHPAWPTPAVARTIEVRVDPSITPATRRMLLEPFEPKRIVLRAPGVVNLVLPSRVTPDSVEAMLTALAEDPWVARVGLVPAPPVAPAPTLARCVDGCLDRRRTAHVLLSEASADERAFVVRLLDGALVTPEATPWEPSVLRVALPDATPAARVDALRRLPFVLATEIVPRGLVREPSAARRDSVIRLAAAWWQQRGRTMLDPAAVFGTLAPGAFAVVATTIDSSFARRGGLLLVQGARIGLLSDEPRPLVEGAEAFPASAADRAWVTPQLLQDLRRAVPGHPFLTTAALVFEQHYDGPPGGWPFTGPVPTRPPVAMPASAPVLERPPAPAVLLQRVFADGDSTAGEVALATALGRDDWRTVTALALLPDVGSRMRRLRFIARDTLHRACARVVDDPTADPLVLATVVQLLITEVGGGQCARRLAPQASGFSRDGRRPTDAVIASLRRVAAHPNATGARVAAPMAAIASEFEPLVTAAMPSPLDRALVTAALAACRAGDGRLPEDVRAALPAAARWRVRDVVANLPAFCDSSGVALAQRLAPPGRFVEDGLTGTPPR